MPKLWTDTVDEHRRQVTDAIIATTADLVASVGVLDVTMSRIAEQTGIGRKTLYKYFPDIASILQAWHQRQIADHLARLDSVRVDDPESQLEAVLHAHATMVRKHHGSDIAQIVHSGDHVDEARQRLRDFFANIMEAAVADGRVRTDVGPIELTNYCLHALSAAADATSQTAVDRLVDITLDGLRARPVPMASTQTGG